MDKDKKTKNDKKEQIDSVDKGPHKDEHINQYGKKNFKEKVDKIKKDTE